jgi:HlyD family secretion protein
VRVGDTVYRNQPFLVLPDMSNLVLRCEIPESDLGRVSTGAVAEVTVQAYPDLVLTGRVESVGTMALGPAGRGTAAYYPATIRLLRPDARLRHGMSADARVLSYANPSAVCVPRIAVRWETGEPRCRVQRNGRVEDIRIGVGWADDTGVEVLDGLQPGERILLP